MTQVIFFDVDGVLIHGYHARAALRKCWDENLERDLGVNRQAFKDEFIHKAFVNEVLVGKRDLKDALSAFLSAQGMDLDPDILITYWLEKDSNINVQLLDVVKRLAVNPDIALYIATNQEENRAKYLMTGLGFNQYFQDIFYAGRLGVLKPHPDYFAQIDALVGPYDVPPIFFDDTPAVVAAARDHGWDAYEFYDMHSLEQCDFVKKILHPAA